MSWLVEALWVVALVAAIWLSERPYKRAVGALPEPAQARHRRFWASTRPPVLVLGAAGFLGFRLLGYTPWTVAGATLAVAAAFLYFRRRLLRVEPPPEPTTVRGYDRSATFAFCAITGYLLRVLFTSAT